MYTLTQLAATLLRLPLLLAAIALFFLMVLTFADVVLRSALSAPIQAATELIRISMAIIVFSALPIVSARGQHVAVDLLDGFFTRMGMARILDGIVTLLCGALLFLPASRIVDLAERARGYGDLTEYLSIPTFYIGWFIAILTFVTAAVMVVRGLIILFRPALLEHDDD